MPNDHVPTNNQSASDIPYTPRKLVRLLGFLIHRVHPPQHNAPFTATIDNLHDTDSPPFHDMSRPSTKPTTPSPTQANPFSKTQTRTRTKPNNKRILSNPTRKNLPPPPAINAAGAPHPGSQPAQLGGTYLARGDVAFPPNAYENRGNDTSLSVELHSWKDGQNTTGGWIVR
ncbi:unnamed protein product [Zymoseptoria tritici ST99CH_1A5]|uniref:Uncharacterized protein n=1 Tax=Zymoseptoria tritici ST99CH_1A5 TaxID=1276529 RepID=A0A1Y6LTR3_ZYMTR|nr:unnamed protein product [Zymoseptoria tritici ST99CH_3D1]SMY26788.1 unnamed protein product [Zymoseptoria tritici ST99CH_1A5]